MVALIRHELGYSFFFFWQRDNNLMWVRICKQRIKYSFVCKQVNQNSVYLNINIYPNYNRIVGNGLISSSLLLVYIFLRDSRFVMRTMQYNVSLLLFSYTDAWRISLLMLLSLIDNFPAQLP